MTTMTAEEEPSIPISTLGDPDEALKAFEQKKQAAGSPMADDDPDDPRLNEEYTFTIEVTDGPRKLSGSFTNKILTIEEKVDVGLFKIVLAGGALAGTIDAQTDWTLERISHMTRSLVKKPAWFKLTELRDMTILDDVYTEVALHEATFRGRKTIMREGKSGSEDTDG